MLLERTEAVCGMHGKQQIVPEKLASIMALSLCDTSEVTQLLQPCFPTPVCCFPVSTFYPILVIRAVSYIATYTALGWRDGVVVFDASRSQG